MQTKRTDPPGSHAGDLNYVYGELRKGVGHELVTDANALELADMAARDGHSILAQELREWQAPCDTGSGDSAKVDPSSGPATP